ncbi:hypothetical protein [Mycobacterium leprae]|uniref:hypothetical protein n=1 Tax=Mycobacterium leprae TaxID=1769 RepID=UPI0034D18212
MRQSMVTAVLQCALYFDIDDRRHLKTTLQRYQTVVEIRDAILAAPFCSEIARADLVRFL